MRQTDKPAITKCAQHQLHATQQAKRANCSHFGATRFTSNPQPSHDYSVHHMSVQLNYSVCFSNNYRNVSCDQENIRSHGDKLRTFYQQYHYMYCINSLTVVVTK